MKSIMYLKPMKWFVVVLGFISLTTFSAQGQLSPYYDYQELYSDALDLFEKGHYGAAAKKIDEYLATEGNFRGDAFNDLHANARFIQAVSAFHLERGNTQALLQDYLLDFGDNTKTTQVRFYLGKYFFNRRDHKAAIIPYMEAYQTGNLPVEVMDELTFNLAYCFFQDGH